MVVALHYTPPSSSEAPTSLAHYLRAAFAMGWSGVDLFFVLSGFLIGGILLDARDSPRYFHTFYLRRAFRILPIYSLVLLIYAVLAYGLARYLPEPLKLVSPGIWFLPTCFLFLQNMRYFPSTKFGDQFVMPLWSLAVEEQFYLVAPLLIRYLSRRNLVRVLFVALLAAPVVRVVLYRTGHTTGMYRLTAARADTLALGVLLAVVWRTPRLRKWLTQNTRILGGFWFAFLAILLALAVSGPKPVRLAWAAAGFSVLALFFGTTMLLSMLQTSSLISRVLRNPVLLQFGTISYCLYLIHDPVNGVCHWVFRRAYVEIDQPIGMLVTLVSFAVAFGLARMSWVLLEKPLLKRGHQYTYDAPQAAPACRAEIPTVSIA
jgi:peptidoglycan/LPS O-acetylase OafA/YrhL